MHIQIKILRYYFNLTEDSIHVISRLDEFVVPQAEEPDTEWEPRLLHRFHIGTGPVNLTYDAIKPNDLLAPLLVCSQWHFWGSTFFYSQNRFVFSSLGE